MKGNNAGRQGNKRSETSDHGKRHKWEAGQRRKRPCTESMLEREKAGRQTKQRQRRRHEERQLAVTPRSLVWQAWHLLARHWAGSCSHV